MKEKQKKLITIIIPTFNSSNFIERSLNSLINQTLNNFDVIISDDGSTDNTLNKLYSYNSKFKKKKYHFSYN